MKQDNWKKFPVLFSLYIAQQIPMSFFSTVLPVIMRQEKYSLESIGLLQLIKLPFIVKFLWAPLVDNHSRTRKQLRNWVIYSEVFYAIVILSIGLFDLQTDFPLIVGLMVVAIIASATQDIGTDIFAIRILKPDERSLGNSMQSSGSFAGSLIGTGVLLIAFHYFGWTNLLVLLALFVLFAVAPLLLYRPSDYSDAGSSKRINILAIFRFFKDKKRIWRLPVLLFYYSGIIGSLAMLKPMMVDLGYDVKQIGFMAGIVGTSVATLMAFLSGFLLKWISQKQAYFLFTLLNIAVALYYKLVMANAPGTLELYIGICFLWGVYGLSTVLIYTSSMAFVRKNSQGTDFTVQIVITHLSSMIIAIFSGKIAGNLGYGGLYSVEIGLGVFTFLVIFLANFRKQLVNE